MSAMPLGEFTAAETARLKQIEAAESAPESFDATEALRRVQALAEDLQQPVFRAAIYTGEFDQGRHEGEDAERLRIATRVRAALTGAES